MEIIYRHYIWAEHRQTNWEQRQLSISFQSDDEKKLRWMRKKPKAYFDNPLLESTVFFCVRFLKYVCSIEREKDEALVSKWSTYTLTRIVLIGELAHWQVRTCCPYYIRKSGVEVGVQRERWHVDEDFVPIEELVHWKISIHWWAGPLEIKFGVQIDCFGWRNGWMLRCSLARK